MFAPAGRGCFPAGRRAIYSQGDVPCAPVRGWALPERPDRPWPICLPSTLGCVRPRPTPAGRRAIYSQGDVPCAPVRGWALPERPDRPWPICLPSTLGCVRPRPTRASAHAECIWFTTEPCARRLRPRPVASRPMASSPATRSPAWCSATTRPRWPLPFKAMSHTRLFAVGHCRKERIDHGRYAFHRRLAA